MKRRAEVPDLWPSAYRAHHRIREAQVLRTGRGWINIQRSARSEERQVYPSYGVPSTLPTSDRYEMSAQLQWRRSWLPSCSEHPLPLLFDLLLQMPQW